MSFKKISLILLGLIASIFLIGAIESQYFKINKSFEIFGEFFRELNRNYVDEIDPEELMKDGIEGILSKLDPYTTFISEDGSDELEFITSGAYAGLGITVSTIEGKLTIVDVHDGFTAAKNGIRVGDRIYAIDTNVVLYIHSDELRKYTKGLIGEKLHLKILRDGLDDTLKFVLTREEINMKNVPYYGIIHDSIGFIKLDRFTKNSASDVTEALNKLKRTGKMRGLILDLRDNPGGLLESAVTICELFVPKNSVIVSTKGRDNREKKTYKSLLEPVEPNIPMAVLINSNSASAAEIVAGALQDLDRAIVIGEKSYGKGLVQSIFELPYNNAVKITTSKYYIPSGRCIQRINYGKKNNADTLQEFFTKNGRKVDESIGIIPDTTTKEGSMPFFVEDLLMNGYIFKYANYYSSTLEKIPDNFKVDEKILSSFSSFIDKEDYKYQTPVISKVDELMKLIEQEKLNNGLKGKLEKLKKEISLEEKDLIKKNSDDLSKLLETEILRRFNTQEFMLKKSLNTDKDVLTAINMLNFDVYKSVLSIDNLKVKKSNN